MQLISFTKTQHKYLLSGYPYLALFSPLATLAVPFDIFLSATYVGYVLMFIGYFSFVACITNNSPAEIGLIKQSKLIQNLALLTCGLLMVSGLALLSNHSEQKIALYMTMLTCTIYSGAVSKKVQQSIYLFAPLHILFFCVLVATSFQAIGFSAWLPTVLFGLALGCVFTAPHLLIRLSTMRYTAANVVPEVRTRKQRRKYRNSINLLASTTGWRWLVLGLLILGPAITTAMSFTTYFPNEFGWAILTLLAARPLLEELPLKGQVPEFSDKIIKEWCMFPYLYWLVLLLIRLLANITGNFL